MYPGGAAHAGKRRGEPPDTTGWTGLESGHSDSISSTIGGGDNCGNSDFVIAEDKEGKNYSTDRGTDAGRATTEVASTANTWQQRLSCGISLQLFFNLVLCLAACIPTSNDKRLSRLLAVVLLLNLTSTKATTCATVELGTIAARGMRLHTSSTSFQAGNAEMRRLRAAPRRQATTKLLASGYALR